MALFQLRSLDFIPQSIFDQMGTRAMTASDPICVILNSFSISPKRPFRSLW